MVRLEATVDIVPLTEVGSHFRQTADAQSAGEFQLEPFIVGQVDDHGVFIEASELWRVVRIAENWMKECFACALYDDVLECLRDENAAPKRETSSGIRLKVSEKGAVSIYGMGRFPVTLYKGQWMKLLDISDDIRAFIAANKAQLKTKD